MSASRAFGTFFFPPFILLYYLLYYIFLGPGTTTTMAQRNCFLLNFILIWTNEYLQTLTNGNRHRRSHNHRRRLSMPCMRQHASAGLRPLFHHHHHYNDLSTRVYYHYTYTAINNNRCPYDENESKTLSECLFFFFVVFATNQCFIVYI